MAFGEYGNGLIFCLEILCDTDGVLGFFGGGMAKIFGGGIIYVENMLKTFGAVIIQGGSWRQQCFALFFYRNNAVAKLTA
jgi:hypothetical protein